jgi:hypothetical protein
MLPTALVTVLATGYLLDPTVAAYSYLCCACTCRLFVMLPTAVGAALGIVSVIDLSML